MSMRTLLIWIIIAGLLGGAALAVRSGRARAGAVDAPATRTLGIDPASVVSVTRVVGDEREVLDRDPTGIDRWVVRWDQGGDKHAWEADPVKARSGLRALATARVVKGEDGEIGEAGGRLIVRGRDGGETAIDFGATSAGGRTPVRVETRGPDGVASGRWSGRIEKSVADAFLDGSLRGLRRELLFDLAPSAVRGVELASGAYETTLTHTGGGWMVESPVTVHAEAETVETMVKSLLTTRAAAFVDSAVSDETSGMGTPLAVVTLVSTQGRVTLRIGTRADVEGKLVYARVERGDEKTLVKIETRSLGKLTAVADAYVGKTPSALGRTGVQGVRVLGKDGTVRLEAQRWGEGGWRIDSVAADSINRDAIDRLLGLLMAQRASGVRIIDAQQDLHEIVWIELVGRDGAVLDRFGVGLDGGQASEGGMSVLLVRDAGGGHRVVWAQRGDDATATGVWLTAVARRPAAAVPGP